MGERIIIENLSKSFRGKEVLKNINLNIGTGMFGLLGRNGAGKTTFMRILATVISKSYGNISICGLDIKNSKDVRRIIGYLPQEFSTYPNLTVYETMDYLGVLSGVPKNLRKKRIKDLLSLVNLNKYYRIKVKALSGGMKRRLGIAQAILNNPKVLIIDEPTVGLDPEERIRFRNLLCEIAENKIVILSTHIVEDIEKTCKRIGVMDGGEMIFCGSIEEFINNKSSLEDAYMEYMEERNVVF